MTRPLWIEHLLLRILSLTPGTWVLVVTVGDNGATWRVGQVGKVENTEPD
jgi:hypothetical protein